MGYDFQIRKPKYALALLCFSVYNSRIRHVYTLIHTIIPPPPQSFGRREGNRLKRGKGKRVNGSFLVASYPHQHTPFKHYTTDKNNLVNHLVNIQIIIRFAHSQNNIHMKNLLNSLIIRNNLKELGLFLSVLFYHSLVSLPLLLAMYCIQNDFFLGGVYCSIVFVFAVLIKWSKS